MSKLLNTKTRIVSKEKRLDILCMKKPYTHFSFKSEYRKAK